MYEMFPKPWNGRRKSTGNAFAPGTVVGGSVVS
jgi:hypothetical protein